MALQCSICLESKSTCPDWSVLVTCGHVFHSTCLFQSLEYRKCCPCCRVSPWMETVDVLMVEGVNDCLNAL